MLNARSLCVVLAFLSAACAGSALAQEIPDTVRVCTAESDAMRRLECYDRAVGRTPAASVSPAAATSAAAPAAAALPPPAAEPSPTDKFGYRGTIAREEMDRRAAAGDVIERLEATVVEIVKQPRGELVVTLDNGQVWAQRTAETLRIRVGDRIVIKSAALGSFLLVAPNNKSSRVVRQR